MSAAVVSLAAYRLRVHAPVGRAVTERKRPHCLRLVQAMAEPVLAMPTAERDAATGLAFYRKYTEAMLRRYAAMSMEQGRVPSLLGRELFRGHVTSCKVQAFDDAVIFVHDVGRCVEGLEPGLRHLVRRIAVEGHAQADAAAMLGISLRTVLRRYGEGLDKLTRMLLDRRLMERMEGLGEAD